MSFSKMLGGLVSAGASAINRYVNKDKTPTSTNTINNNSVSSQSNNVINPTQNNANNTSNDGSYYKDGKKYSSEGNRLYGGMWDGSSNRPKLYQTPGDLDGVSAKYERVKWGEATPNYSDPDRYNFLATISPEGNIVGINKSHAESYINDGYKVLGGMERNDPQELKRAYAMSQAGKDWEDDGYNSGYVTLRSDRGGISTTHARTAYNQITQPDKYGVNWSLDPRSQSIQRALQSGKHKAYDRRNNAIRKGGLSSDEYNNMDFRKTDAELGLERYMRQVNPIDGDPYEYESQRWKFDGGDGLWGSVKFNTNNASSKEGVRGKNKSEVKEVVMPSGNTAHQDGGSFFITKPNGQKAEVSEVEYQKYMMLEFGI